MSQSYLDQLRTITYQAPYSADGINPYFATGNFGLNTGSPAFTFDVNGTINFTGNLLKNGVIYPDLSTGPTGPVNTVVQTLTSEPTGFPSRSSNFISFSTGSNLFSIGPSGANFNVWVKGQSFTISSLQSVTIPSSTNLYYLYFSSTGSLGVQTTFFIWDEQAPTSYIYYNAAHPGEFMLFDERHGVTMDWATHEYLHRTRGAAIANGFGIYGFGTTGSGNLLSDVQFSLQEGTFFDEDLQVDITNGDPGIWSMQIQSPATLPTLYLDVSGWRKTPVNTVPFTIGINNRMNYNSIVGGVGSIVESANNRFTVQYIVATNMAYTPICAIMGQNEYTNIQKAQETNYSDLYLVSLPIVELRPLYKLIYEVADSFTNGVKSRLVEVVDIRTITTTAIQQVQFGATGPTGPSGIINLPSQNQVVFVQNGSLTGTNDFTFSNATGLNISSAVTFTGANINIYEDINMNNYTLQNPIFKSYDESITNVFISSTGTILDCNTGNNFICTFTGSNNTGGFTIINAPNSGSLFSLNIFLDQGTVGSKFLVYDSSITFGSQGNPTLSTSPNSTDVINFLTYNGGSKWLGFLRGKGF